MSVSVEVLEILMTPKVNLHNKDNQLNCCIVKVTGNSCANANAVCNEYNY